ncbi:MAG: triose-phosphate isomerase [Deltaproteobacteria bacterium]|jgi:triosephosphate isomerase|nr:triose-phosphate isomerase [Deltaproteobacteria bacterium]
MAREPFLAGNWKMYKTGDEAVKFIEELKPLIRGLDDRRTALAAPATALRQAAEAAAGSGLIVGAQNLHWAQEGAYTGEISASMIKAAGATMVILGHSERRQFFGDDDALVAKKLAAALAAGLLPVVCLGENLAEREAGRAFEVLAAQLQGSLAGATPEAVAGLVLAYEPVWAIGTGRTATAEQAQQAHEFLRGRLAELFGRPAAEATRILYGGSVKPDNAKSLMERPDIDGVLVGGASLKADSFAKIVRYDA